MLRMRRADSNPAAPGAPSSSSPLPARLPLTTPLSASPQADADYDASSNPYPPSRLGMLLSGTGFRQKRDISRVNEKNFRNLEITPCGATYCEVLEDVGGKDEYVRYPPCKGCKRYDGAKKAIYGANVLARKRDALDSVSVLRNDRGEIAEEGYDLGPRVGFAGGQGEPGDMDMWSSRGVLQTIRLEELCCKHKPRLSRRKGARRAGPATTSRG